MSTSEDKIVSKSDAAQNSEEKASKNWSSVGREDVEKKKANNYFYNDDLILNINIFYVATRLPVPISSSYLQRAGSMTSLREAPKNIFLGKFPK